jgi:hypothetical protein
LLRNRLKSLICLQKLAIWDAAAGDVALEEQPNIDGVHRDRQGLRWRQAIVDAGTSIWQNLVDRGLGLAEITRFRLRESRRMRSIRDADQRASDVMYVTYDGGSQCRLLCRNGREIHQLRLFLLSG